MIITKTSPVSGRVHTMDLPITEDQLAKWENGINIKQAMPNLTSDEVEFLISGVIKEEWEEIYAGFDEDF